MRTVMAVRARVRFRKTGHTLEFGPEYSSRWSIFWLGRTHVHNAERTYDRAFGHLQSGVR